MNALKDILRRARRRLNQAAGRDLRIPIELRCRSEVLGSGYGGWAICPDSLSASSVVYSVGVGRDITFDLAMIERFGVTVHAFDPTPKAITWVKQQPLPPQFVLHEYGLAGYDGIVRFTLPRADWDSFSMTESHGVQSIDAPVHRLHTIMSMLGHDRIDVLKMDIEGAELAVIDDLAATPVPIDQLLVEFHHHIGNRADLDAVRRAIGRLHGLGFRLFHNSVVGKEFSFKNVG